MRCIWFVISLALLTSSVVLAEVRKPAVAGSFYPADYQQLSYQVNKLLDNVPTQEIKGEPIALIVPHAGYPFSGQVAAWAYKQLAGRSFDTVILIGSSHQTGFNVIALPGYDAFETPLGKVPVDKEFIAKLIKLNDKFVIDNKAHQGEHALEVQLPFLQTALKGFKIVPILFGNISLANCQSLAYALGYLADDRTLIVISTDWSHYHPYDVAKKMDLRGLNSVLNGSIEAFVNDLSAGDIEACGAPGVITALVLAPALGANRVELFKYLNSGDTAGEVTKVVGYAALGFYRVEPPLSTAAKKKLLKIARRTLEAKISGQQLPVFTPPEKELNDPRGVFVTLTKAGKLRGCIGYIQPVKPLFQAVQEMAVAAATEDNRFEKVTPAELKPIRIEISVLSRFNRIKDQAGIEIGRDGLFIIKGERSGLLLPQVAVEWGWDRDEFLKQVCLKAGLPADAWRSKEAALYRFTADIFHE